LHLLTYHFLAFTYVPPIFLYCSDPHPDLHSFPTRRSSDLVQTIARMLGGGLVRRSDLAKGVARLQEGLQLTTQSLHRASEMVHRSEEHTSELQSRFDLVCRLLLEKKKKR